MISAGLITVILVSLVKCAAIVGLVLFMVAYSVVAERRFSAMIQDRIGPNRVGPLGLLQPICDGVKFLLKEEYTPEHVRKLYFTMAPIISMVPALLTVSIVPFGDVLNLRPFVEWLVTNSFTQWLLGLFSWSITLNEEVLEAFVVPLTIADLNVGVLFFFAIVSISVYGIVLAGWASNSKFPFLGGIRASAQMISYELTMGLSVVPVFLVVSELNLGEIISFQQTNGWLAFPLINLLNPADFFNFSNVSLKSIVLSVPLFITFVYFLISAFAETNRLPFDLAECETELVGGYHTEYASMKFALFFLGEYAAMIVSSCIMVTLFFGGWYFPGMETLGDAWWVGLLQVFVFIAKMACFMFIFIWVRWTLPRFRYDQLMNLGWKVFIPLAFLNVFLTAILVAIPDSVWS
ncbi:MAG: NADH-quinone oxidoreductase subunit H [Verrucomicrobiota bacterium]